MRRKSTRRVLRCVLAVEGRRFCRKGVAQGFVRGFSVEEHRGPHPKPDGILSQDYELPPCLNLKANGMMVHSVLLYASADYSVNYGRQASY